MPVKPPTAPCPRCGERALLAPSNPWRPFCSERCQMIDLGRWAAGEYAIPAEEESPAAEANENSPRRQH